MRLEMVSAQDGSSAHSMPQPAMPYSELEQTNSEGSPPSSGISCECRIGAAMITPRGESHSSSGSLRLGIGRSIAPPAACKQGSGRVADRDTYITPPRARRIGESEFHITYIASRSPKILDRLLLLFRPARRRWLAEYRRYQRLGAL